MFRNHRNSYGVLQDKPAILYSVEKPPALTNIKITLDHFFKFQLREFLGICGYRVESEHEMLHFPKKLDALVIGEGSAAASDFKFFNYFRRYNLISYKSFNDSLRVRDIYALSLGHL